MKCFHFAIALLASCMLPLAAQAQAVSWNRADASEEEFDALQQWELTLTPRAESQPALRYSLWPRYRERTPGDATPYYYRALMMQADIAREVQEEYRDRSKTWSGNELNQATRDEMRAWVAKHRTILAELRTATYRERIDLDLRLQDLQGMDAILFLLPDAQGCRDLARVLHVQGRLAIEEGRYEDALESILTGYRLGQFAARTPTLINDLVGVAICAMMNDNLTRLIAEPEAPNLYWAIATLPRPMIDLRESLQFESGIPAQIFPFLEGAEQASRSSEQWQTVMVQCFRDLHRLSGEYEGKPAPLSEAAAGDLLDKIYPLAKEDLLRRGKDPQRVEKMPPGQVVAMYTGSTYRFIYDEMFKWTFLPPHQAVQRWEATHELLRERDFLGPNGFNSQTVPIAALLMPMMKAAWYAPIRLERQFASLRMIEALRMHAAANGGRLPESLDEITVVPVPADPLYEQPLTYQRDGNTAVLETPPRPGIERRQDVYRYLLKLKQQ